MDTKFNINEDHFRDKKARMGYLFSRTTGKAQKHLQPRYKSKDTFEYKTTEEILDTLRQVFNDPNELINAQLVFSELVIQKGEVFTDFYTDFLVSAGKAKISQDRYQFELRNKVTMALKSKLIGREQFTDHQACAAWLTSVDQGTRALKDLAEKQNPRNNGGQATRNARAKGASPVEADRASNTGGSGSRSEGVSRTPSQRSRGTQRRTLTADEQAKYVKGECFLYGSKDHIKYNYPQNP